MAFARWIPLLLALSAAPPAAQADALAARQAQQALERGAQAWDVRDAAVRAWLPGAARADLVAWSRSGSLDDLAHAVSAAGIDLSREVVVYGRAGDSRAQALVTALQSVAGVQVHWLVGGIDEWLAAGLPTVARAAPRLPVPQRLVRLPAEAGVPAAAALRAAYFMKLGSHSDRG